LDINFRIEDGKRKNNYMINVISILMYYIENVHDYIEMKNEYYPIIKEVVSKGCDVIAPLRDKYGNGELIKI
jgi:basic membrane lipoprotein Med (substrate-binding protein (PBP1-ABC) superfamily)